ncbi:MAG: TetR/AcrR family transcriptional regulator [bacterium]|nr:TetR/AcrR family transcriptional regulator [bacterium]
MRESYTATPRLLYVATQLFLKQGFAATSVDQICRTTGVSKGAFFHYYHSKDDAAEAAIDYFWELLDDYLFGGLDLFEPSPKIERIRERMIELPEHLHFENGSLLAVVANEVSDSQRGIRVKLEETYDKWSDKLAAALEATGYETQFSKRLARQWIAVYEGAVAQAKAHGDKNIIREQLELFGKLAYRQ